MAQAAAKKENSFAWEGTDQKGNRVKGKTTAASEVAVKQELRRQGIVPLRVKKQSALTKGARGKKITPGDIAVFMRQMSTMMTAGVPLVQSFEITGRGHENPRMQDLILEIKSTVEGGATFAEALGKHPDQFDDLTVNLVEAGEQAGALETLLDKIATYKEKTEAVKAKIKKALFYPIAVLVVALIVTVVLLVWVIPQFQDLFEGFGADLPAFTQMVIDLSEFVRTDGWMLLLGGIGVGALFTMAKKRSPAFRRGIDRVMLKLPIIGTILYKAAVARFARTLSTMFSAGVPLVEALESVSGATGNIVFQEAVLQMRDQVASGQQLNVAMSQADIFPNMVTQMVAIGEEAGAIDTMAAKVADFYEEEVDNMVDSLSSLLEPLIMAVLGVLVGGLVVAMYLPIFQLGKVV